MPGSDEREVQQRLSAYANRLYAGRGPGISRQELVVNTRERPAMGGVPTADSREQVYLRTLAQRGEVDAAEREAAWWRAQLRPPVTAAPAVPPDRFPPRAVLVTACAGLGWLVLRRLPRSPRNSYREAIQLH